MRGDDEIDHPRSGRPMTFLGAALWSLGLGFVGSVLIELTEAARPGAELDLVNLTACRVVASSLFVFAVLRVYAPDAPIRDVLAVRAVSPLTAVLAAVAGVLFEPGLARLDDLVYARFPLSAEETDFLEKVTSIESLRERLVLFVSFAIVVPICEELFFRGVLFRGMRRGRPEGLTILASALLFALSRGDPRSWASALGLGALTAWMRGRSGSLVPALVAHLAMGIAPFVPILLGKGEIDVGTKVSVACAVGAALCVLGVGQLLSRDGRAEQARHADG